MTPIGTGPEPALVLPAVPQSGVSLDSIARTVTLVACFFLSWQLLRLPQFNLTLSDIAFALALVALLLAGRLTPSLFGRMTVWWMGGVILLLGGLFLGSLANELVGRWFIIGAQYFIVLMVLPIVLTSFDREFLGRASLAFAYGVAVSQVLGIAALQFFGYHALTPYVGRTVVLGNDRIGAMTAEPNANGAVCVFAIIFLLAAALERRIPLLQAAMVAAIIAAGLVFSASFTAFVALAIAGSSIALLTWSNGFKRIGVPTLLAIVVYVGLGGPLPEVFVDRVAEAVIDLDLSQAGTFEGRSVLIREAWETADPHLLIGMGVDRYRELSVHGAPVHNLALLLLNEGGVLSLVGLGALLLCLISASIMIRRVETIGGAVCFGTLIVIVIFAMSLPHMYARHWFGPVALIFATYLAARPWQAKQAERQPPLPASQRTIHQ